MALTQPRLQAAHSSWARWVLLLMCAATLAPGVSRWRAHGTGWQMVEVCSGTGARWVLHDVGLRTRATSAKKAGPEQLSHLLDACGLCLLAAERFAPLVSHWHFDWTRVPHTPQPTHLALPFAAFAVAKASARGPPLLS